MAGIEYRITCEAAPLQIEGSQGEVRFFFRSRHDQWVFKATRDAALDPADLPDYQLELQSGSHAKASHMSVDEALEIIRECIGRYRRNGG